MYSLSTSTDLLYSMTASLIGAVLIVAAIIQLRADKSHRSPDELRNRRRNYFPIALVPRTKHDRRGRSRANRNNRAA